MLIQGFLSLCRIEKGGKKTGRTRNGKNRRRGYLRTKWNGSSDFGETETSKQA